MAGETKVGPRASEVPTTVVQSRDATATAEVSTEPHPAAPAAMMAMAGPRAAGPDLDARRFEGFELVRLLGKGAFAQVYLAKQVSLDRLVALKVATDSSGEARTLASLEHPHIVQVYSETADPARGVRLLCMQLIPGTALDRVIRRLNADRGPGAWHGRDLLAAIDADSALTVAFDPEALRTRELLGRSDGIEAACWIGARLAEALAHAHARGILHRDLKPANILLDRYGRPLLADFNLALDPRNVAGPDEGDSAFGGTIAYMAPEHLEAFNPDDPTPHEAVDEQSDVYALGVVLFELIAGRRPFGSVGRLADLAAHRRAGAPSIRATRPELSAVLDSVLRRCLAPEKSGRYAKSAELAEALEGCRDLRALRLRLPPAGPIVRAARRRPAAWLVGFMFLPHVVGSVVNVAYNVTQIVAELTPAQKRTFFDELLIAYNLVVYPACLAVAWAKLGPPLRTIRQLRAGHLVDADEVGRSRRRVLSWAPWAVALACVGWLPGGLIFPVGLHLRSGPVGAEVFGHFLVSFWTSGLIALTYSYFGVQFLALRVFYAELWTDPRGLRETARRELGRLPRAVRVFQLLAGTIPLLAAALLVGIGPVESASRSFRLLTAALIVLGMAGFGLALAMGDYLSRTLAALAGPAEAPEGDRAD